MGTLRPLALQSRACNLRDCVEVRSFHFAAVVSQQPFAGVLP
jgi:hypothetical protein